MLISLSLFNCAEKFEDNPVGGSKFDSSNESISVSDENISSEELLAQDLEQSTTRIVELFDQLDEYEREYQESFDSDSTMSPEKSALLTKINSALDSLRVHREIILLDSDFLKGVTINGVSRIMVEEREQTISTYKSISDAIKYTPKKDETRDFPENEIDPASIPRYKGNYYPIFEAGSKKVIYADEDEVSWPTIIVQELDNDQLDLTVLKEFSNASLYFSNDATSQSLKENGKRWAYTLEFHPFENFNGLDSAIIQVSDGSLSDTLLLIFDVNPQNDDPILKGIANTNNVHTEGDTLVASLESGECIDPYDTGLPPELKYAWYRDVDNIRGNGNEERTENFDDRFVLQESDTAYYYYVVAICIDGENFILAERDTSGYTEKVLLNDYAPTFVDGDRKYIEGYEDALHSFEIAAEDDNDSISWRLVNDKSNHGEIAIKKGEGNIAQFEYTPEAEHYGEDEFKIVAQGGRRSDTVTVIVETYSVNDAPQVILAKKDISGPWVQDKSLSIEASCFDVDEGSEKTLLSYTWYRDDNDYGYNGSKIENTEDDGVVPIGELVVHIDEVNKFIYAIIECQDAEGLITKDTTDYSYRIFEAETERAEKILSFNGQNQWIELGTITPNLYNGITIEAMVNWESGSDKDNILMLSDESGKNRVSIGRHNQDTLAVTIVNDEVYTIGAVKGLITDNQWTHIAVTIEDGQPVRIYKNGFLVSESHLGFPKGVQWTQNYIGRGFEDNSAVFKGKIDEIRIWENIRTISELRTSMFSDITPETQDLYAGWDFNNVGGAVLWDVKDIRKNGVLKLMDNSNWLLTMKKIDLKLYSNYVSVLDTMIVTLAENMAYPLTYSPSHGFEFTTWEFDASTGTVEEKNQATTYFTGTENASVQLKCSDILAPEAPTNIYSVRHSDGTFVLKWEKSTDNSGILGYNVYKNGEKYGYTDTEEIFVDTIGLASYTVSARDLEDKISPLSNTLVQFEAEEFTLGKNIVADVIDGLGVVRRIADSDLSLRWKGQEFDKNIPAGNYKIAYRLKPITPGEEFNSELWYKSEKKISISGSSIDAGNGWTYISSTESFYFDGDNSSTIALSFNQSEFLIDWVQMQPLDN
ncbi:MAG: hypothetical protein OCD01_12120 [Fibrobacterales bacterium]